MMELLRQFLSMDRTISFSTGRRGFKPRLPGWFCERNRSELWGSRVASQIYRRVMDMRNARINCRDEKAISFHAHLVGIARGLFARLRAVGCFDNRIGRITPPHHFTSVNELRCKTASGFPVALSSCPDARCCVAGYFHCPGSLPRPITYKSLK